MQPTDRRLSSDPRKFISECALFRGFDEKQRTKLNERVKVRKCIAGESIFLMDSFGGSLLAVVDGKVQITGPSPEGKEIILAVMYPGDVFGEIGLLDGKDRSADATAMTACTLAILDRSDVLPVFEANPHAYCDVVALLCERIRRTTNQIVEVVLMDLPSRIAKALLRMALKECPARNDTEPVRIRLSQRELGNIVGATRESVNKCLSSWQKNGLIEVKKSEIMIKDHAAIELIASE